jgi:small GTP-binding protein
MEYDKVYKVIVLGTGGVGKSALTIQLVQGRFAVAYDPTIEDIYKKTITVDGREINLDILDTAGQDDFQPLRATYMRNGHGIIIVFAIIDRASFLALDRLVNDVRTTCEREDIPIVVCGNKCDLPERSVTKDEAQRFCADCSVLFFETSCKTNVNVTEAFVALARKMREGDPNGKTDERPAMDGSASKVCCNVA